MPIFLSMIVWVVLMRILCSGSMRYTRIPGGSRAYKVPVMVSVLTMGYIVFWIGMRNGMADTSAYLSDFIRTPAALSDLPELILSDAKGAGWKSGIVLFKAIISEDWQCWLLALAAVTGFSVSACFQKYSEAFFFSMLLFIMNGNFSWMYNGMRQFVCVTSLMLALPWLIKGETKKYLLLIAGLSLIHLSVWLMVPIYFVVRQKPWGKLVTLSIVGVSLMCGFAAESIGAIETVLENTSYKGAQLMSESDDGANPIRALVLSVPAILAWFSRKHLAAEHNALLNVCINFSLIAALLMFFAVCTSGIMMGRLAIYCSVYSAILLPMLISRWPDKKMRFVLKFATITCYAIYMHLELGHQYYTSFITGWVA